MTDIRRLYQEKDSVLNTDIFDRERFAQLTELSPKLGDIVQYQKKENRDFPSLMGDMWASLYKMKPTIKEFEEGQKPNSIINQQFMERILDDEQFQHMRKTTKLDDFTSAIGSMRLNEKVHEWINAQKSKDEEFEKLMNELRQKQKDLANQQEKQQAAEERQQDAQNSGDESKQKKADSQAAKEQNKTENLQQNISDLQSQIQQQLSKKLQGDSGQSFSDQIANAAQETKQTKDDLQNLLAGGSGAGNGEGELKKLPLRDQITMGELLRNNKKMKQIAEWAGKFKAIARKKQKSKHTNSLDRSGMTLGDDVERLLPQELGMLVKDSTKLDFLRRYAEGQTMMYSPKGKESLGKGPIVICLDQSGSMSELDNQSKGFVLALAMIAKRQRRDFAVVTFSNNVGEVFTYEKGKVTPAQLVELAQYFKGGGTNYVPALNAAKVIIEKQKRFKKADILFVTDGEPGDTGALEKESWKKEFFAFKHDTGTSIMSLLIGSDAKRRFVQSFSDKVIHAKDFHSNESHDVLAI
jgi:uncharacterized protein with von Willebrand factor type A (vWA) domain